jgi:hypothetical protein
MKSGFSLITLLILILIGFVGFIIFQIQSESPSKTTQSLALTIPKYPNSKKWEVKHNKQFCILNFNNCKFAPSSIVFLTDNRWGSVYNYYKEKLIIEGWSTNSEIFVSVPTNVVFTKNYQSSLCSAHLREKSSSSLKRLKLEKSEGHYAFNISCMPN